MSGDSSWLLYTRVAGVPSDVELRLVYWPHGPMTMAVESAAWANRRAIGTERSTSVSLYLRMVRRVLRGVSAQAAYRDFSVSFASWPEQQQAAGY